ncbi:MAG TPA: MFS transporter [Candidatus Sulfotelmatobacter sp.]|jgi:predicted MFS family arabinose efflux permease|nr:MFS transporter [Candidatus Sulfotelmatobacter sp.]
MAKQNVAKLAFRFVLIIGVVNFFADMTYEGARSIVGPFLGSLGASAAIVGFVAGFGELVGYGLRSVSGYFADKTHRYWAVTFVGYAINMLAVPALALAGNWPLAAALVIAERTGRAIRRPAVSMLSHAGKSIGQGWVFGLNEALDQTGATIGPLITAFVLYRHGDYHHAFAVLLISALLCLAVLFVAWFLHRRPHEMEESAHPSSSRHFSKAYWLYLAAGALIAAGFADFSLIAFHFQKTATVPQGLVPVFYAVAMATGAVASLVLGKLLDKLGLPILLVAFGVPAFFAPLVFLRGTTLELIGMILWGIGMGAQDSCLKAVLSAVVPSEKRSTAFGIFDTGFGVAWFAGSAIMGLLYDKSIPALILFSVVLQLLALPLLAFANKEKASEGRAS